MDLSTKIKNVPQKPGVYIMKDGQGYFVRMYWPDCLDGQGDDHCTTGGIGETPPMYPVDEGWNLIGVSVCDCNEDGKVDRADVDGDCCYEPLPCVDCQEPCGKDYYSLNADQYLAAMNVGGQLTDLVLGDEARVMRWWEPWKGFNPNPGTGYSDGAKWHNLEPCMPLWPGMGFWMYSSLPDLTIIPPVPGDCG